MGDGSDCTKYQMDPNGGSELADSRGPPAMVTQTYPFRRSPLTSSDVTPHWILPNGRAEATESRWDPKTRTSERRSDHSQDNHESARMLGASFQRLRYKAQSWRRTSDIPRFFRWRRPLIPGRKESQESDRSIHRIAVREHSTPHD